VVEGAADRRPPLPRCANECWHNSSSINMGYSVFMGRGNELVKALGRQGYIAPKNHRVH
jgi:hypothetical protein